MRPDEIQLLRTFVKNANTARDASHAAFINKNYHHEGVHAREARIWQQAVDALETMLVARQAYIAMPNGDQFFVLPVTGNDAVKRLETLRDHIDTLPGFEVVFGGHNIHPTTINRQKVLALVDDSIKDVKKVLAK